MKKGLKVFGLLCLIGLCFIGIAIAQKQKFVSIEPHMGYGNAQYIYFGGKIYNYDGESGTRNPYYRQPELIATFDEHSEEFKPNSEGYFWLKMPLKEDSNLQSGTSKLNQVHISINPKQKSRKNSNLILVTNFGLNAEKISVPFIEVSKEAKYLLISDFDNTITKVRGLGILEFISTNPKIFNLREGIPELYQAICSNNNPVFYVTARPLGTYRVVQTILDESKLPAGPVLARDLGFWFINKGYSITDHKINAITSIMETYPDKKIILIGDNKRNDPEIYSQIYNKYKDRVLQVFIFNTKRKEKPDEGIYDYVSTPQEVLEKLKSMGLIEDNNK